MISKVEIPKGLLIGLVGVAAAAVLGMVFLLGRESAHRNSARIERQQDTGNAGVAVVPVSRSAPVEAPLTPFPPEPPLAVSMPSPAEVSSVVLPRPTRPEVIAIPSGSANSKSNPVVRTAVVDYFKAVQRIQPESSGDPEAMAQQVVAGLAKGDTSGFDGMILQAQTTRSRLSAITPPPPCVAYHMESLASLDAGLDLMRAMKKALSASESSAPMLDLADRANALKARTEALHLQEKSLKQRYAE